MQYCEGIIALVELHLSRFQGFPPAADQQHLFIHLRPIAFTQCGLWHARFGEYSQISKERLESTFSC